VVIQSINFAFLGSSAILTLIMNYWSITRADLCFFAPQLNFDFCVIRLYNTPIKSSDNQMGELHLCWTGNIEQLKQFVSDNIELNGVWVSPGGDKKKYSDGDTSIS
jgi:hypothetical protein